MAAVGKGPHFLQRISIEFSGYWPVQYRKRFDELTNGAYMKLRQSIFNKLILGFIAAALRKKD